MKKTKLIAALICLSVFAGAAIASSSSTDETTKSIGAVDGSGDAESNDEVVETEAVIDDITIEEQVLVDRNNIVITATEYVVDNIWGDGIKINIQNNSSDNIMVGCDALIVNNYMINDLFASDVAAGMQANETVYLSTSELEAAGITNVGEVEIYFHVFNNDTYEMILEDYADIHTSAYDDMVITDCSDGYELYNEGGIRIVGKTVDENSFWGTAILLYIENTSGENVGIRAENMAINGIMVDPIFSATVYNERMCVDDITIFSSDLEENGITSIDTVQLSFTIYDVDTYMTITNTPAIEFSAN